MALENKLHGGLAVPILIGLKVVGVLELISENFVNPVESLDSDFIAIGSRIGQALEKMQVHAALEAERAKSVKNAKLASLGEMSAGIAHEINNPLAIISGSVGLLSKCVGDPVKFTSRVDAIKKSCDRIARIVAGLRKFARTGGKTQLEPHLLNDVVKEVLVLTESKAKRCETLINIEFKSESIVNCDEVEMEQVLVNLINNAIDAVRGRSERWVKILLFEEPAFVVLQVLDSGLGISENVRTKLFEPFFTTKGVGGGTGLGLSIAKGILDEHQATISVLTESRNTCFEIRFPKVGDINHAS